VTTHEPHLNVFLSGEVHTDWRDRIIETTVSRGLPIEYSAPITDHASSDDCGVATLGAEPSKFWHDHKGAKVNSIRTRTLLDRADVVVVRFGERYRQWNAAFDAGIAAGAGVPIITLHPEEHDHALKEIDAVALAVARTPEQVVDVLAYVIRGELPVNGREGS
jgi:YtoQ family protein